ncbi:substrate-binding domain-containing protein [Kitasatospora purpeofusca]|uniref:substrate-binding domain-containing protein n=1 Tax=Kitasatospora purpeofusca TaxID=67352 RepID=UPI002A5ABA6A|nr:substrate-binding domain-containing protein [Kitasatospora purpeofusca]MDY0811143.1 substrate-binding domain-containing protein [Kitasatospora purpeofusca]
MKRVIGVLTVLLVLGGLAFAVVNRTKDPKDGPKDGTGKPITLTGMVGSEKGAFFDDQRVKDALKARGLVVNTQSAGSWQMGELKNDNLDFVFPASQQPAEAIKADHKLKSTPTRPFYSPLVIVTHKSTADVLALNKLASWDEESNVWKFSMKDFLAGIDAKQTWQSLPRPPEKPGDLVGSIFLTTTNPETSSSGALYLAMVSYLLNANQVVPAPGGVTPQISDELRAVISPQGVMKNSTEEPFMDFVSGNGRPLVLAYESQALELVLKGKAPSDMVMLYPDTTVVSDHTIVAFNDDGQRLADALADDPALRELEIQYGFRPSGAAGATAFAAKVRDTQKGDPKPPFAFAPDLGVAKVSQATVPTPEVMKRLVEAAKTK